MTAMMGRSAASVGPFAGHPCPAGDATRRVAATAPLGIHASQTGPAAPHPTDVRRNGPRDPESGRFERLLEVLDEIVWVLDAAAEPDQVGRDRGDRVFDRLVGHRLRHLDQRLDAPE